MLIGNDGKFEMNRFSLDVMGRPIDDGWKVENYPLIGGYFPFPFSIISYIGHPPKLESGNGGKFELPFHFERKL